MPIVKPTTTSGQLLDDKPVKNYSLYGDDAGNDDSDLLQATPTEQLANSDYFPSQSLSPVETKFGQGAYGAIPVVQGGEVLLPFGQQNAYARARAAKNVSDQEDEQNINKQFAQLIGSPSYQTKLDQMYFDDINSSIHEVYNRLGHQKATAVLKDPFNPVTSAILQKYHHYETLSDATQTFQGAIKEAQENLRSGNRTLGQAQMDAIKKFQDGTIPLDQLPNLPTTLSTYKTIDAKLKDLKDAGILDKDIESTFTNGVTADGKLIRTLNGSSLLNETAKSFVTPERIDAIASYIKSDPDIDPNTPDDVIHGFLQQALPSIVKNKLTVIHPDNVINVNAQKAEDYTSEIYNRKVNIYGLQNRDPTALSTIVGAVYHGSPVVSAEYNDPDADQKDIDDLTAQRDAEKNSKKKAEIQQQIDDKTEYKKHLHVILHLTPTANDEDPTKDIEVSDKTGGGYYTFNELQNSLPGAKKIPNEDLYKAPNPPGVKDGTSGQTTPAITSQAELDKLPSGASYTFNGQLYKKK